MASTVVPAHWHTTQGEACGLTYIEASTDTAAPDAPLVIALHGRGGSVASFATLVGVLDPRWRFIFPQAPTQLDVPDRDDCYSWYEPIMSDEERQNGPRDGISVSPQLLAARSLLRDFLRATHERLAISPARSALIGFSQGAALGLDVGLRAEPPYAALASLCSYLPEADDLPLKRAAGRAQPILLIRGTADDHLRLSLGRRAKRILEAGGLTLDDHEFPTGHEIATPAREVLITFLQRTLQSA